MIERETAITDPPQQRLDVGEADPCQPAVRALHAVQGRSERFEPVGDIPVAVGEDGTDLVAQDASPAGAGSVELILGATSATVDVEVDATARPTGRLTGAVATRQHAVVTAGALSTCAFGGHVAVPTDGAVRPVHHWFVGVAATTACGVTPRLGRLARSSHESSSMVRAVFGRNSRRRSTTAASPEPAALVLRPAAST